MKTANVTLPFDEFYNFRSLGMKFMKWGITGVERKYIDLVCPITEHFWGQVGRNIRNSL